ncbi:MAG: PAS domain-containing protein [Proteobacteria bacterium]|nr:PAS domain-containing protein [Pseudomonadota bacterium]MBI3496996.1 PAS domain-containing protein [Pseudomonadota bacterium]
MSKIVWKFSDMTGPDGVGPEPMLLESELDGPVEPAGQAAEAIGHPELIRLHAYWAAKCRPSCLPSPRDLNPAELADFLGNALLADIVESEPLRIRYRLVGTRLVELWGRDPSGKDLEELYYRPFRQALYGVYRNVIERRRWRYDEVNFRFLWTVIAYHRLLLPLSTDGVRVDSVLTAIYPNDPGLKRASQWRLTDDIVRIFDNLSNTAAKIKRQPHR